MIRLTLVKPDRQTITLDYSLPTELVVGRSSSCNLCLEFDSLASRRHAVFSIRPPKIYLRDLKSTNGVAINGVKHVSKNGVELEPMLLHDGDQVLIGETKIKVSVIGTSEKRRGSTVRYLTTHGRDTRKLQRKSDTRRLKVENVKPPTVFEAKAGYVHPDTKAFETSTDLVPIFPPLPGWSLSRYLTSGTAGGLYLAEEKGGGKFACVKILAPGQQLSWVASKALHDEAAEARQARHAYIANFLSAGEIPSSGGAFIAYEMMTGNNLAAYQARQPRGRLSYHEAYGLIRQLTEAVSFLHRRDMLHLDLKPTSVILYPDGVKQKLKLTDHGFHEFLDRAGIVPRGNPSRKLEKLGFIAPEELLPETDASMAADVFSLGAIFYHMLTGKSPYRFAPGRDNEKVVRDVWMHPIDVAMPELPVPLVVIIERALSTDPDMRYLTAVDMLEALENVRL